jgi:glutaredoxin
MLDEVNLSLFGNRLRIQKIDISKDVETAKNHNVLSVPTIIIGGTRLSVVFDKNELTDAILQGFISSLSMGSDNDQNGGMFG